jgi:hypothetical protein
MMMMMSHHNHLVPLKAQRTISVIAFHLVEGGKNWNKSFLNARRRTKERKKERKRKNVIIWCVIISTARMKQQRLDMITRAREWTDIFSSSDDL